MSSFNYFVIINESEKTIASLENIIHKLSKNAIILKFTNSEEGMKAIEKQKRPTVLIISKLVNGLQILAKLQKDTDLPKHHIILLTDKEDQKLNVEAIKLGASDILSQPYSVDKLIFKIRNAYQMVKSSNSELELKDTAGKLVDQIQQNAKFTVDMLAKIINVIYPKSENIKQNVAAAEWIAKRMTDEQDVIENIILSAKIAYLGRILMNPKIMTKPVMIDGMVQNEEMENVPKNVKELIGEFESLKEINNIVYHIHENFDGSGIPEKIKAWKIPLGSRILRVCLDYIEFYEKNARKSNKAMDALLHESTRLYDHRIIALYDQFLASHPKFSEARFKEVPIDLKSLEDGMVLSRNIITDGGLRLVPAGQEVNETKIEKIKTIAATDPIIGNIYIQR